MVIANKNNLKEIELPWKVQTLIFRHYFASPLKRQVNWAFLYMAPKTETLEKIIKENLNHEINVFWWNIYGWNMISGICFKMINNLGDVGKVYIDNVRLALNR